MYLTKNVLLTLYYFCILHAKYKADIFNYKGDVLFTSRVPALREIRVLDGTNTLSFCSLQCLLYKGCTAIELCHQDNDTMCRICNHTNPSYTNNSGDVCHHWQLIITSSTTVGYGTQSSINSASDNTFSQDIITTETYDTGQDSATSTTIDSITQSNDDSVTFVSSVHGVCSTDCIEPSDPNGFCYRGTRHVTWRGKTCMKWSDKSPHNHNYNNPSLINNYCRNPDSNDIPRPWCYTTDPNTRWEYCDIPVCSSNCVSSIIQLSNSTVSCVDASIFSTDPNGMCYRGTKSVTENGRTCQMWSKQFPHIHFYNTFPSVTKNYCRNPDGVRQLRPWCYTTKLLVRWEYCDISVC